MADISKIDNGTEYNLKDATARAGIESSKTLKSSVVTVTDASPINAEDITVDITPVQDLHGYDRPWVGGAWKNKLPMTVDILKSLNTSGTWSGNVYNINNGMVEILTDRDSNVIGLNINGEFNASTAFHLIYSNSIVFPNNQYILNGIIGGSENTYRYMYMSPSSGYLYSDGGDTLLNLDEGISKIRLLINSRYNAQNVKVYPMIRLATETDATFAPYSNECPIGGRTGAKLDRCGKNWLPFPYTDTSKTDVDITWAVNNDGTITATGTNNYSSWRSFKIYGDTNDLKSVSALFPKAGTYTISCENSQIGLYNCDFGITDTDGASWIINQNIVPSGSEITITEEMLSMKCYLKISIKNNVTTPINVTFKPMIRLASITDSTYEPYQGEQYTADFGETVHGGKWHVTAGGTDKQTGEVDLGSLTWYYSSQYQVFYANISGAKYDGVGSLVGTAKCASSQYARNTASWLTFNNGDISVGADTRGNHQPCVTIKDTSYTDTATFKSAMNGVQLVYELATPTTISTPKQNVPMLQGINTVYADCGDVNLKYQPDNVIGELKGEIEDNIIYEDFKWTTNSSQSYSAGTPGTYGTSSWRDVKKEGYDVIGVTFVENRRFGDCILTLNYIPSTDHVEVIIFRATSSAVTIADEDIAYRVAYKKRP